MKWSRPSMLVACGILFGVSQSVADPVPGFIETWNACEPAGWLGQSGTTAQTYSPGYDGSGCSMFATRVEVGRFEFYASSTAYQGDWLAAGITSVRFHMRGNPRTPLPMYFVIGNEQNLWLYATPFDNRFKWMPYSIDLTDPSKFVHIIDDDALAFGDALHNVTTCGFRYDFPPFDRLAENIHYPFTTVELDQLELVTTLATPAAPTSWGRIRSLYR